MLKTTTKHFQLFKKECERWIRNWGLTEWEVHFGHQDLEDNECWARTVYNYRGKTAKIYLNIQWEDSIPLNEKEIRRCAIHEVIHLLLGNLSVIADDRYIQSVTEITHAEHEIINKLANYLLK